MAKSPLIIIACLITVSMHLSAQNYTLTDQQQLQKDLEKASSKARVGIALTGVGLAAAGVGYALYMSDETSLGEMMSGFFIMLGGVGMVAGGVPTWITGHVKKKKIELELVKYNNAVASYPGSKKPVYGAGLRITF